MRIVLEVKNLSFSYPDGHQALKGISFSVFERENVAIIGPNGAGKSTLLLHFNSLLKSNGSVNIMGISLKEDNLKWVRSKVGLIFQDPNDQLFCPTIYEDVAFGPLNMGYTLDEVDSRVKKALEAVGMSGFEKHPPHHLSIGQKKRIALATVVSMTPEILAMDEPTSSLDPRGKWEIINLLKKLPGTKIIATHDLELAKALCPRTIILDHGKLVADGLSEQLLDNIPLLLAHGLANPFPDGKK